ncbi:MAG: hypothetical protein LBO07_04855 [Coriobacteriales bacterium]|jgi:hypothetical protein|nr:hypothetical protein [Coriobacteriales bacterium]
MSEPNESQSQTEATAASAAPRLDSEAAAFEQAAAPATDPTLEPTSPTATSLTATSPTATPEPEPTPEPVPAAPITDPNPNPALEPDSAEPPSPFKPISEQRIEKARRTRVVLTALILILVVALLSLGFLGYRIIADDAALPAVDLTPATELPDEALVEPSAPAELDFEETVIPELTPLFGLTIDEIKTKLGSDWVLSKTDVIDDPANPDIRELATFSFTVQSKGASGQLASPSTMTMPATMADAALPAESIYASFDEDGVCIDIYYSCDMRLLAYPLKSFDELLATPDLVFGALAAAGITPKDFAYTAPDHEASIEYDNSNSENRKIIKQTTIFSGRIDGEDGPVAWTLTVIYDYGMGVSDSSEYREASRMLYLKIA